MQNVAAKNDQKDLSELKYIEVKSQQNHLGCKRYEKCPCSKITVPIKRYDGNLKMSMMLHCIPAYVLYRCEFQTKHEFFYNINHNALKLHVLKYIIAPHSYICIITANAYIHPTAT